MNYKREMYALAHLNLSIASFKYRIYVFHPFRSSLIFAVLDHRLIQM